MLTYFSVKNYRGFKNEISLDLTASNYEFNQECIHNGYAQKALIYGYNGVGKTNFGHAIMDIIINLTDKEKVILLNGNYWNAESGNRLVEYKYKFKFNDVILEYNYGKHNPEIIVYENLHINGKCVVSYNREKKEPLTIDLLGTQTLNKDINRIPISVLKYIKSNAALEHSLETTVLADFFSFVDRMLFVRGVNISKYAGYEIGGHQLFDKIVNNNHFDDFITFLKKAALPSNVVFKKMENEIRFFFKYNTNQGQESLIDYFSICSTGMQTLTVLFFWLQSALYNEKPPSFIFIDEFDAFYHQRLSEYVVNVIKKINNCQFILTTHDTGVMSNDIMRPDCLFLMFNDNIKSISSLTDRELRFAHNIEKMYRAGVFNE